MDTVIGYLIASVLILSSFLLAAGLFEDGTRKASPAARFQRYESASWALWFGLLATTVVSDTLDTRTGQTVMLVASAFIPMLWLISCELRRRENRAVRTARIENGEPYLHPVLPAGLVGWGTFGLAVAAWFGMFKLASVVTAAVWPPDPGQVQQWASALFLSLMGSLVAVPCLGLLAWFAQRLRRKAAAKEYDYHCARFDERIARERGDVAAPAVSGKF